MAEIAEAVGRSLGSRHSIVRPALGAAPPDRYLGDGAAYRRLRDRFEVAAEDFSRQVEATACFMGERLRLDRCASQGLTQG